VVGWQVVAAVSRVEEHNQPTAVMVADLFNDPASDQPWQVDHKHISRPSTLGQLDPRADRRADHGYLMFPIEQADQLGAAALTPVQQGHVLRDV
jgi:hypothetical protein